MGRKSSCFSKRFWWKEWKNDTIAECFSALLIIFALPEFFILSYTAFAKEHCTSLFLNRWKWWVPTCHPVDIPNRRLAFGGFFAASVLMIRPQHESKQQVMRRPTFDLIRLNRISSMRTCPPLSIIPCPETQRIKEMPCSLRQTIIVLRLFHHATCTEYRIPTLKTSHFPCILLSAVI